MCPHFDGALVHPVYATWTAVYHMEIVGRKLLAPYLAPDQEAVGTRLSIEHKSMAMIGSLVTVRAVVRSFQGHRLICDMSAETDDRVIAEGEFVQTILPKSRLEALMRRHS